MIANEVPAKEVEPDKSHAPVGHLDPDRIEKVRTLFDQRAAYLDRRQLDIRLRRETVDRIVQGKQYSEILDIGCGDGSISMPLLNSSRRLTLIDISSGMLSGKSAAARAFQHLPAPGNVLTKAIRCSLIVAIR